MLEEGLDAAQVVLVEVGVLVQLRHAYLGEMQGRCRERKGEKGRCSCAMRTLVLIKGRVGECAWVWVGLGVELGAEP